MIFGFDIDGTVFNVIPEWVDYIDQMNCLSYKKSTALANDIYKSKRYNLSQIFKEHLINYPMDFWHRKNLYDDIIINEKCRNLINSIKENGNEVLFISDAIKYPEHIESKCKRIEHYFGESKFIFTSNKEYIGVDFFIDDSPDNCYRYAQRNKNAKVIQFLNELKYLERIELPNVVICESWDDIEQYITK